jgi:AAA family ATP:ADP antiporter
MTARIPRATTLDRLLRPFTPIKPGEGKRAGLLIITIFLLFTAYYVMKTAREGLILAGGTFGLRGDLLKTYASGAMAVLLIGLVPAYDHLVDGLRRIRLINISYAIVFISLGAFYVLGRAGVPLGLAYFLWFGLVAVLLVAQFWGYAADLYDEEQGVRLFAIIAAGGSLGAIAGPRIARLADTFNLMWIAAVILVAAGILFNVIEHGLKGRDISRSERPIEGPGGFSLVLRDHKLLLIGSMLILANIVNTTGEFLLSNAARAHAIELVPATSHPELVGAAHGAAIEEERRELIKMFYSDFYVWVNLLGFLIQAFLVSRIVTKIGIRNALFILPVIAFGAYGAVAVFGGLAVLRLAKIVENSTDYSLQNTVWQALFLRANRAVKYKAKATLDTFFVRVGDLLSAVLVALSIHTLGIGPRELAFVNVGLIVVWGAVAAAIAHQTFKKAPTTVDLPPAGVSVTSA